MLQKSSHVRKKPPLPMTTSIADRGLVTQKSTDSNQRGSRVSTQTTHQNCPESTGTCLSLQRQSSNGLQGLRFDFKVSLQTHTLNMNSTTPWPFQQFCRHCNSGRFHDYQSKTAPILMHPKVVVFLLSLFLSVSVLNMNKYKTAYTVMLFRLITHCWTDYSLHRDVF